MKLRLVEFEKEHALVLVREMKGLEGLVLSPQVIEEGLQEAGAGPAWTAFCGESVVGCGGIALGRWGNGTGWLLLGELFYENVRETVRLIKERLVFGAETFRLKRVEAFVYARNRKALKFAEKQGFKLEGYLENYGPNGENVFLYARLFKWQIQ